MTNPLARPVRAAVAGAVLAGGVCATLMAWLRPRGWVTLAVILASVALTLATIMRELVIPDPPGKESTTMQQSMDDPLPGLEPDPPPNPEPPAEEQDHLAAKWGDKEGPGDAANEGVDSES